ncbi:hypothetical protein SteCoe_24152 [Stentor coeruleus]|uniref:Uncharacterized protein n=1 Tax=Stentor coeruleus TaxID=5963 RepID=A0A1R2BI76_9CILI|nr:hypothetical protein SteCoe_24152 [Stentor coeruleus]
MMVTLLTNSDLQLIFTKKIFMILYAQSVISVAFASISFSTESFQYFFKENFWLMYLFSGLYTVFSLTPLVLASFRKPPQNDVILFIVILSIIIIDTCAVSADPGTVLQTLTFLSSSILGLVVFSLFSYAKASKIWALVSMATINILVLLVLFFVGFQDWGMLVIFLIVGLCFGGYLLVIITDLCDRYSIKNTEISYGTLLIYADILIIPYIITKIQLFRNKHLIS